MVDPDRIVEQDFAVAGQQQDRRQAGEVGEDRRGKGVAMVVPAEVCGGEHAERAFRDDRVGVPVGGDAFSGCREIGEGRHRDGDRRQRGAAVAGVDQDGHRQATAGGITADGRVLGSVFGDQGVYHGRRVLECGGKRMFRSEPVVGQDDGGPERPGQGCGGVAVSVCGAHDVTATMEPDKDVVVDRGSGQDAQGLDAADDEFVDRNIFGKAGFEHHGIEVVPELFEREAAVAEYRGEGVSGTFERTVVIDCGVGDFRVSHACALPVVASAAWVPKALPW